MSESVTLPALGESVTEGTVTRWLKKVGDRVEVDEPLLEVSTDKVDTEIPSPIAGVVEEIFVAEDETVEVGAVLVRIGDGTAAGDAPQADETPQQQDEAPQPEQSPPSPEAEAPAEEQDAPGEQPAAEQEQSVDQQPAAEQASEETRPEETQPEESQPEASETQPESEPAESEAEQPEVEQPGAAESEQPVYEQPVSEQPVSQQPASEQPVYEQPASEPQTAPEQAPSAPEPAQAEAAPEPSAPVVVPSAVTTAHAGYVTPIVRKLAHDKGIDLDEVTGTGVGGRIRKQDVLAALADEDAPVAEPVLESTPAPALETSPLRGTTVPMSRLRRVVAERAVVSMQTLAQLTTVVEVDVTRIAALRDHVKADFRNKTGTKLTFLPFFVLAAAEALRAYPIINATVDGENIVYPDHEHISIAVDTERGLLTPVIRDAGDLDLTGIAREIADLAERTRENKLKPDELGGGTFTVTNTGSRGALFDTPIVFLPQSAILGTGIVTKKPVVVTDGGLDAIAIRSTVYLALSYDHRIVDGADAARFLSAVKARLEGGDFESALGI
jgi:2-oxoglutarate dehydrogenase E2 component (dihydrolipoamide succinyltransferase)